MTDLPSKVTIRQVASPIRRKPQQRQTLIGLGLNKIGRESEVTYTHASWGMLSKVAHMLKIEKDGKWIEAEPFFRANIPPVEEAK